MDANFRLSFIYFCQSFDYRLLTKNTKQKYRNVYTLIRNYLL